MRIIILIIFFLSTLSLLGQNQEFVQKGVASYYGKKFHGKQTASGEIFNMNAMTAAHKKLPFNTWVKVTNLNNNKSVEVKINDRGPYAGKRIIDLSRGAAEKIGLIKKGLAKVSIEVIPPPAESVKE